MLPPNKQRSAYLCLLLSILCLSSWELISKMKQWRELTRFHCGRMWSCPKSARTIRNSLLDSTPLPSVLGAGGEGALAFKGRDWFGFQFKPWHFRVLISSSVKLIQKDERSHWIFVRMKLVTTCLACKNTLIKPRQLLSVEWIRGLGGGSLAAFPLLVLTALLSFISCMRKLYKFYWHRAFGQCLHMPELGHQGLPRERSSQTRLAESQCFLLRMSEKQQSMASTLYTDHSHPTSHPVRSSAEGWVGGMLSAITRQFCRWYWGEESSQGAGEPRTELQLSAFWASFLSSPI